MNSGGGGGSTDWSAITSKPTTLSGFGITDAYTQAYINATFLPLSGGDLTGSLHLPNEVALVGRNAANSGDINLIFLNSANAVDIGDGAIIAGAGLAAFSGEIRIPNDVAIVGRNAAGTGDVLIAYVNTSNAINIGDGAMVANSSVASFPADVTVAAGITAAAATIGGYPVMRVRHSVMSGGIPTDMVEGEVWFGTVS